MTPGATCSFAAPGSCRRTCRGSGPVRGSRRGRSQRCGRGRRGRAGRRKRRVGSGHLERGDDQPQLGGGGGPFGRFDRRRGLGERWGEPTLLAQQRGRFTCTPRIGLQVGHNQATCRDRSRHAQRAGGRAVHLASATRLPPEPHCPRCRVNGGHVQPADPPHRRTGGTRGHVRYDRQRPPADP